MIRIQYLTEEKRTRIDVVEEKTETLIARVFAYARTETFPGKVSISGEGFNPTYVDEVASALQMGWRVAYGYLSAEKV